MPDIQYRNATEKDLSQVYLFEGCYMRELEPDNYEAWANARDRNYKVLHDNLDNMMVAERDGMLIGHCYWSLLDAVPHIFSIYVSTGFRGRGVAKTLLSLTEDKIKSHNFHRCSLSTLVTNPARWLFVKQGYEIIKQENNWLELIKTF